MVLGNSGMYKKWKVSWKGSHLSWGHYLWWCRVLNRSIWYEMSLLLSIALYLYSARKPSKLPSCSNWWHCDFGVSFVGTIYYKQERLNQHSGISANIFLSTFHVYGLSLARPHPDPLLQQSFSFPPSRHHLIWPRSWIIVKPTFLSLIV